MADQPFDETPEFLAGMQKLHAAIDGAEAQVSDLEEILDLAAGTRVESDAMNIGKAIAAGFEQLAAIVTDAENAETPHQLQQIVSQGVALTDTIGEHAFELGKINEEAQTEIEELQGIWVDNNDPEYASDPEGDGEYD